MFKQFFYILLVTVAAIMFSGCAEENPFLPKISQKGLPAATDGYLELRYIGNRTTVQATLSKTDLMKLIPSDYGGDLEGSFGGTSTLGSGTYLNSNFKFVDGTGSDCSGSEQCYLRPESDSIYLLNFELTKKGGLLENSLAYIRNNYGSQICTNDAFCSSEQKMGALMAMKPSTIPVTNIPILGTIYDMLLGLASWFSLDDNLDQIIREGVAGTYSIGVNDYIVSPEFVQEATVRKVMYYYPEDKNKTLVLCEENSAVNGGKQCTNPGGLRKGAPGFQELPADPVTQLADPGPGYRDPSGYVGSRIALPIFLGDSLADFQTLFTGNYKDWLRIKQGKVSSQNNCDVSDPSGLGIEPRYRYLRSRIANGTIYDCAGQSEMKTLIMYNQRSERPDPDTTEFFQRLPVTISGTAYDGFDLTSASYAGADSLTEDAILLWVSDRGAYFGGCLPNSAGVYWSGCADPDRPWVNPATGGDGDFYGAGMYMANMNPAPRLDIDMYMTAEQARNTVETSIEYQYKDKTYCIGLTLWDYCDFGLELNVESLTQSLTEYFYDSNEPVLFELRNIDVGLSREEMIASVKQSFNGYINNDFNQPITDPGDFQSVSPGNNYYCDPLQPGFPGSCSSFRPGSDSLSSTERLYKARAQRPLRQISDTLFDNSSGSPNFYLTQMLLYAENTSDCTMVNPRPRPVLIYQDQGGAGVKAGFYSQLNSQGVPDGDICAIAGNCISGAQVPRSACSDTEDKTAEYAGYLDSNRYIILNNNTKTLYIQAENATVYRLDFEQSSDPDIVRARWELCDGTTC